VIVISGAMCFFRKLKGARVLLLLLLLLVVVWWWSSSSYFRVGEGERGAKFGCGDAAGRGESHQGEFGLETPVFSR
jgi:hypothetical protein